MSQTTTERIVTADPAWSLDRDLRKAAQVLGDAEVRYLVDSYYAAQDFRKQNASRRDAAAAAGEPNMIMNRLFADAERLEKNIRYALDKWGSGDQRVRWARSIDGIGPVIAAGLAAHTHIDHCPTVGHLWAYAGLDPTRVWGGKGHKRPHNAGLKTLCWKAGESFVKVSNKDTDVYGKVYRVRREREGVLNEEGRFAEQAAAMLKAVPHHKQKETYAKGKLPDSHLHSRAKRYAVKLFLAHWHHVCYEIAYGTKPPFPYILEHPGVDGQHVHYIAPPNWPMAG